MWSLLIIGRALPKTVLFVGFTPSSTSSSLEIRVYIFVVYIEGYFSASGPLSLKIVNLSFFKLKYYI